MNPKFFARPADFRKWLEENHDKKTELLVGFWKKGTGKPSITWPESVDQALCFGWIDGITKSLGEESFAIRFTPRKNKSHWSAVNLKKYAKLKKLGEIHPSGEAAFSRMDKKNSKKASFEQKRIVMGKTFESKIKASKKAWSFFNALAPSYKKASTWWVISAKQEETKLRRLAVLIKSSEEGEKIPMLRVLKKK
jgi:uncharacterized protein YdeI (YjbR/CyaY-like superfamily)